MGDFSFYFGLGWFHIISAEALDHILFIIALAALYTIAEWKKVLILVTAFTIGHSLTLALSVYDVFRFPENWTEFLIPLTIVITAVTNLFQKRADKTAAGLNYIFALVFGLIHGMGFANALRFILAKDQSLGWSLFAFNIGLEAGQVIVVIVLLLLSYIVLEKLRVNRREWILFLSAAVFSVALQMTFERIPK